MDYLITQVHFLNNSLVRVFLNTGECLQLDFQNWELLKLHSQEAINETQYLELQHQATRTSIYHKALELLGNREHSEKELSIKLRQRFQEEELIQQCIQELQEKNLQCDLRFAQAFVESKTSQKSCGPYWLLAELQKRGVSREIAEKATKAKDDPELWLRNAQKLLEHLSRSSQKKTSKQELWKKLYQRGFPREIIEDALSNVTFREDSP
ncbi:RecX family transcriptional regulator [Deltaproteobacteria bacterium TL4]